MLLRGLHTFDPRPEDHDHTLAFSCNDCLLFLEVLKRDSDWLRVADLSGYVGFIPKTFVEPHESCSSPNLIQSFLVDAVVKARYLELPSAPYLEELRDQVRQNPSIVRQRAQVMRNIFLHPAKAQVQVKGDGGGGEQGKARRVKSDYHLRTKQLQKEKDSSGPRELRRVGSESELEIGSKPPPPQQKTSRVPPNTSRSSQIPAQVRYRCDPATYDSYVSDTSMNTAVEEPAAKPYSNAFNNNNNGRNSPRIFAGPSPSLLDIKSSLVNVVQETSGLGPVQSENVLAEVFQRMKDSTNKVQVPVESLLEKLSLASLSAQVPSKLITDLEKAMTTLAKMSRAGIKTGLANSPSTTSLLEKLEKLRKSLIACDPIHATQLLQLGQHSFSQDFAHLYQLESPMLVKERMLDILLIILTLDKKARPTLLSSTLPIYLSRDMMAQLGGNNNNQTEQEGRKKLFLQLVNVLISLLACGEPMPETHFQILGTGFVNFILKEIESSFSAEEEEANGAYHHHHHHHQDDKIKSDRLASMINLLLVYNLQFRHPSKENIVLRVLSEWRRRPRGFFTVLLGLFKKEHDPLLNPSESSTSNHSVFKMLNDICLCQRTASLLTSADKKKLMEVITDGLFENSAGGIRLGYVQVLEALLPTLQSHFSLGDLRSALLSILLDSDPLAVREQQLIRRVSKECPALFIQSISKVKMNVVGGHGQDQDQREALEENDYSYLSS